MTYRQSFISAVVGLLAAATLAQSALATGEPKNQAPFTRVVHRAAPALSIQGEAKNELPFTGPTTVVVASTGGGFDWTDAAIGGVAGLGIALSGAGVVLVARRSPQTA